MSEINIHTAATLHTEYLKMAATAGTEPFITSDDMVLLHSRFESMMQWSPLSEQIPKGADPRDVMETAITVLMNCYILNKLAEIMGGLVEGDGVSGAPWVPDIFRGAIYSSGPAMMCSLRDNLSAIAKLRWSHWGDSTEFALSEALDASGDMWSILMATAIVAGEDVGALPPSALGNHQFQAALTKMQKMVVDFTTGSRTTTGEFN